MKKMISGLIGILFLCLFFRQAWADSTEAKASAKSEVEIYQDDHSQVDSFEKRQFPLATEGPATFVGTPFTQIQKGKWFIFWTQLDKEFTVQNIEMMRKKTRVEEIVLFKWLKRHVRTALREKSLPKNEDPIHLLNWDPEKICHPGDKEIAEVSLTGDYSWKPWPFISVLGVALDEAKKKSQTRRVVVYLRFKDKVTADGLAIGTGGAGAKMMGPAGEKVDNIAGVLTAGAMIGTTSLTMEDIEEIRIRCLNDGLIEPPTLPKKEEPKPEAKAVPSPPVKQEVEVKIKIEIPPPASAPVSPPPAPPAPIAPPPPPPKPEPKAEKIELPQVVVYFDYDKYEIKETEKPKIKRIAEWLMANPTCIAQTEGHCSEPGSLAYNAALGRKRSLAVYEALLKDGASKDQVFQFISVSKDRLVSGKNDENQRVIIRLIGPASGK